MYELKDFDYSLPEELIAQKPTKPRDHSRLLLLDKKTGAIEHRYFFDLVDSLQPGDLLVLNDSKVFPARLLGHKEGTGGAVEIFLHREMGSDIWECLAGGKVRSGIVINFPEGLEGTITKDNGDGTWQVRFNYSGSKFWRTVYKIGLVPLPPYIKRTGAQTSDKRYYQTVFAADQKVGSVAAPTAGLHFTTKLLKKIREKGVKIGYVTLHVGLGTFASVKTDIITEHKMHSEFVQITGRLKKQIAAAKMSGGRVVAVGTTSCRALESLAQRWSLAEEKDLSRPESFWTNIFIYPGYKFKIVDALITNFHLPKSTLLMLVSALGGKRNIDRTYREAIERGYLFFSYGHAMFIH